MYEIERQPSLTLGQYLCAHCRITIQRKPLAPHGLSPPNEENKENRCAPEPESAPGASDKSDSVDFSTSQPGPSNNATFDLDTRLPGPGHSAKHDASNLATNQRRSVSSDGSDSVNLTSQPGCYSQYSLVGEGKSEATSSYQSFAISSDNSGLQKLLEVVDESPISKKRKHVVTYSSAKKQKVYEKVNEFLKTGLNESANTVEEKKSRLYDEMIQQLHDKFDKETTSRRDKIQLLTILPQSLSINEVMSEFDASKRMVQIAKQLYSETGVLSKPAAKGGNVLESTTSATVQAFYLDDENSRILAGKKDFVSVKQPTGQRERIQKRLVLCNLKELYRHFCDKYPDMKIGFSRFATLRPPFCVLAGQSGTHTVCVCTLHHNVKLKLDACRIGQLTSDCIIPLNDYKDCLKFIVCKDPTIGCFSNKCKECPGTEQLAEMLKIKFDDAMIDTIKFSRWISVDRSTLETLEMSADDFVDTLCCELKTLLLHDFIAKQQTSYHRKIKENLEEGEFVVDLDFAQNYAFVAQDASQGFHWNNDQATIHPFVIYYKSENGIVNKNLTIISDCLEHVTSSVYAFQRILVQYLKAHFSVKKIYYFSDGAPQQYKNCKNFINLLYHKEDFGIDAEWHFFATAHGKGACDGISGTVKRLAGRASLQLPPESQILTPQRLFDWATQNIKGIDFCFSAKSDHDLAVSFLKERYTKAKTVPGTLKFHAAVPADDGKMNFRVYSSSTAAVTKVIVKR